MNPMYARTANLLLSSWLVVSAFAWPHARPQLENAVVVGALCFVFALVAVVHSPARWWNVVLGAWLVVSFVVLPDRVWTDLHNAVVGAALCAFALVPTPGWQAPVTLEQRLRQISDAVAHAR